MKFNSLEELINYIWNNIMDSNYDRYIKMSFGENDILMFVFVAPAVFHILFCAAFGRIILWVPKSLVNQCIGHILLLNEMPRIVMRVCVSVVIPKVCHEFSWCVSQVQRH